MSFEFHSEALDEYHEAAHYYAQQQSGLDLRFVESLEEAIKQILQNPKRWRPFDEDVRRAVPKIFPYRVVYTIEDDFILVIAIAHTSRAPDYWKHRRG